MDQEKIGNFIKKIRTDNDLSQKEFADMFGVSFQAVSKWENGKNIPDISTLRLISEKFDIELDDILKGEKTAKKNDRKLWYVFLCVIAFLIAIVILLVLNGNKNASFQFDELTSSNSDFTISGSVVRTSDRTSLIINNVNYKGVERETVYEKLSCNLYEDSDEVKTKISSCEDGSDETLLEYLEGLKFRVDHYSTECTMFTTSKIYIEILASESDRDIIYRIPVAINDSGC